MQFEITAAKQAVLDLVTAHQQAHLAEYAQQIEGWQAAMETYSANMLAWSKGDIEVQPVQPYKPDDFSSDYDNLLAVIALHDGGYLILNEADQRVVVNDTFSWSDRFFGNSALYIQRKENVRVHREH